MFTRLLKKARRCGCRRSLVLERLEERVLLSAAGGIDGQAAVELFNASSAVFVENAGQWADESVRYAFSGAGTGIAFRDSGVEFRLSRRTPVADESGEDCLTEATAFTVSFDGASASVPVGLDMSDSTFNYQVGDESLHRDGVSGYGTVAYPGLYSGIDLHTFGRRDSLKYEFHVAPGADPAQIRMSYDGIQGLTLDEDGALHVATELGVLVDDAPYTYQIVDGQEVAVASAFVLLDDDTCGFAITGAWDPSLELIIDPDLDWSTYLGGSVWDQGSAIAVDGSGRIYVTGYTYSSGWASGGFDDSQNGDYDVFVAKLSASGAHEWSTYLGGSGADYGRGIVVDGSGGVCITGDTWSSGWVSGGFDDSRNGHHDAFVAKLTSSGGHVWSTYLGGRQFDRARDIAVDDYGDIYVTGDTWSSGWVSGGYDVTFSPGGYEDAFVAKLSASGAHKWSTYLGWIGWEEGRGIAVDADGVYVTGYTNSPVWVSGGFDVSYNGGDKDAFVAKLTTAGRHEWSTYLGGSASDDAHGIAVDDSGSIYVTGETASSGWASGGFDETYEGSNDAFVAKLTALGGHEWSTYLGGIQNDAGSSIAVDAAGVYVTGDTESPEMGDPGAGVKIRWVTGGFDESYNGGGDAFVVELTPSGEHEWSTYLGGSGWDQSYGIAVDACGDVCVTGETFSTDWPGGGFDETYGGNEDAFVAKLDVSFPGQASICGVKFDDLDGDGVKDVGEPGLAGWTINLTGTATDSAITAADGSYSFTGLEPGSYTVAEVMQVGWTQTLPAAPGTHTVTVAEGDTEFDLDFGNYRPLRIVEVIRGAGGQTVTVVDTDSQVDIVAGDVRVAFGWSGNSVSYIMFGGWASGPMTGLALIVSGASNVGLVLDQRGAGAADLSLFASDAPVGLMLLNGGVAGYDVNGQSLGGLDFPVDIDGDGDTADLTGISIDGKLGTTIIGREIAGDVVADGLGLLLTRTGGLSGDLRFTGDGGPIILNGNLRGRIETTGGLSFVSVRMATDAQIDLGGRLGFLSVTGACSNTTLNVDSLGGMVVTGDFTRGQVNTAGDVGFASFRNADSTNFNIGGKLNFVSVSGNFVDSSLNANALGFVSVRGFVAASELGTNEIHAETGSFILFERDTFHGINYPHSFTDKLIFNVRVWVG